MPEEQKILRVEIEGTWTLDEFSNSLRSIGDIYGLRGILAIEHRSLEEQRNLEGQESLEEQLTLRGHFPHRPFRRWLRRIQPLIDPRNPSDALQLLEPNEQLYVKRIQFASPGCTDLAGLGTIVGHVKDFLLRLIEVCTTAKQRRLENDQRELDNDKKRIENARGLVGLAKEIGYSSVEIRQLVRWVDGKQARLLPLIEQGKIHSVRLLDEEHIDKG